MRETESSDSLAHTLSILSRLQSGPPDELEAAPLIERCRISARAPYMMRGVIDGQRASGALCALDAAAGWARLIDRWVRLGAAALPGQPLPDNDTVMRCAAIGFILDGRPDLGAAIRALAAKVRESGFAMVGYLLELAALEADAARWPERLEHIGDQAVAALHQRGGERKARRARNRLF